MDPIATSALLAVAAFAAGVLNAIAGGGTFLTFPALVWAGVPPIAANATSALAVCPGYLGSALGFRQELAALPRALLIREVSLSAIGGVAGALLLLVTPAKVFSGIVPWLLLFATVLFAAGPGIARCAQAAAPQGQASIRWREPALLAVAAFVIAGAIARQPGLLIMVAATAGGFMGARWSKRLPVAWVRGGVIVTGLVMSAVFFYRM